MDLIAPDLPDAQPGEISAYISTRRPGLGEALGAQVQQGFSASGFGAIGALGREVQGTRAQPELLTREEWEASGLSRPRLEWDERMTRGRAEAMAREYDEREYRRRLGAARDPGAAETALGFGAQLLGAIPSPENFIPFAGPAARGLRALGATRTADTLMAPGVGAAALRGATDATIGTAAIMPLVLSVDARYGEDVTFGRVLGELAIGALIGTGFGAVGGLLTRGGETRIAPDTMAAVRTLDAAARDVAAGRPVTLPSEMAMRAIDDALVRSAPPEMRDVPVRDLPTRPDGRPLDFEQFQEDYLQRRGLTLEQVQRQERDAARAETAEARNERSLVSWLVQNGGVRDDGGDMRAIMGTAQARPGLLNRNGRSPDEAVRAAREAGFFDDLRVNEAAAGPGQAVDPLTPRDLFDAIDAELRGMGRRVEGLPGLQPFPEARTVEQVAEARRAEINEAYQWYLEALDARQIMARLSADTRADLEERAAMMEFEGGMARAEAEARAVQQAREADPELQAMMDEIAMMRMEGRLSAADDAILRAGDEQAQELEALSRGQTEAGACLLRNMV